MVAHPLLKFRNVDTIRSKLKAKSKDVRIAACRLLGSLCSDDDVSAEALAEYALAHDGSSDELDVALHEVYRVSVEGGAIARSAVFFEKKLCKVLTDRSFNRPKTREVVFSILDALKGTETCLEQRTLKLLRGLFADYRVDEGVAKKVISTFGSVAPLEVEFAEFFVESLRTPPHGREAEVMVAVSDFLGRCGQRVSTIRKIRETLSSFRDLLIARISKLTKRRCTDAVKSEVKNARYALSSIVQMERTYNEVASTPAVSG